MLYVRIVSMTENYNLRAQRVIASLGFRFAGAFPAAADGRNYGIWILRRLQRG
jgi:RimJ/RimL family protein N-acetyltransferase